MTEELIAELLMMTLRTAGLIAAPVIISMVVVGITVNVLQTVTQIRDQTLIFVPKVITAGVVIVVATPWYLQLMQGFFETVMKLLVRSAM